MEPAQCPPNGGTSTSYPLALGRCGQEAFTLVLKSYTLLSRTKFAAPNLRCEMTLPVQFSVKAVLMNMDVEPAKFRQEDFLLLRLPIQL
jgi:hypothetical protein